MSRRPALVRSPALQALFVTFLWSTSWVLIKLGLSDDLPPLTFAGLRYSLAAVVLGGVLDASPRHRRELAATNVGTRGRLVLLGLVMYALTQGAQFVGLDLLPAAMLSLCLSFTPALVVTAPSMAVGGAARWARGSRSTACRPCRWPPSRSCCGWCWEGLTATQWQSLLVVSVGIGLVRRRPGQANPNSGGSTTTTTAAQRAKTGR